MKVPGWQKGGDIWKQAQSVGKGSTPAPFAPKQPQPTQPATPAVEGVKLPQTGGVGPGGPLNGGSMGGG
jgi:hypothetical protein